MNRSVRRALCVVRLGVVLHEVVDPSLQRGIYFQIDAIVEDTHDLEHVGQQIVDLPGTGA